MIDEQTFSDAAFAELAASVSRLSQSLSLLVAEIPRQITVSVAGVVAMHERYRLALEGVRVDH